VKDTAGQTTTYTFNGQGQLLTIVTPPRAGITENRTTTWLYNANGYLRERDGPATGAMTSYTYDSYGRTRTLTDSDGYVLTFTMTPESPNEVLPRRHVRETVSRAPDPVRSRDRLEVEPAKSITRCGV
jgi:YD repeat-containing protein